MVNYSRMEDVWRSYGPVGEPVGPSTPRRAGAAKGAVIFGVAALAGAGAVLGLYLQSDRSANAGAEREDRPAAVAQAEPVVEEPLELQVAEAAPAEPDLAAGGALPVDTVPPSEAPPAPPVQASAAVTRVAAAPQAQPAPRVLAPASQQASRTIATQVTRPAPAPVAVQRPALARAEVAPAVPPRVAPPAPKPIVLARREEAPQPAAVPTVREAPSFSCANPQGAGAQTVCNDPRLARLDRIMAAEFAAAVAAGHDRERLELDQDSWLARREAAAPDPNAVADVYRRRIAQLRSMW